MDGSDGVVILDAVKLLQSDLLELCSGVWVVQCSRETELERLVRKRNLSPEEADARLASQPPFDHPKVTEVIDNSGSMRDLEARVQTAWSRFTSTEARSLP